MILRGTKPRDIIADRSLSTNNYWHNYIPYYYSFHLYRSDRTKSQKPIKHTNNLGLLGIPYNWGY